MTAMPNPFLSDPAAYFALAADTTAVSIRPREAAVGPFDESALAPAMAADTATAPGLTDPPDAVAGNFDESSSSTGGSKGAPAVEHGTPPQTAGATDLIHEIFVGALKLGRDIPLDELIDRSFDVHGFMDEIDEAPLFLRRTA